MNDAHWQGRQLWITPPGKVKPERFGHVKERRGVYYMYDDKIRKLLGTEKSLREAKFVLHTRMMRKYRDNKS